MSLTIFLLQICCRELGHVLLTAPASDWHSEDSALRYTSQRHFFVIFSQWLCLRTAACSWCQTIPSIRNPLSFLWCCFNTFNIPEHHCTRGFWLHFLSDCVWDNSIPAASAFCVLLLRVRVEEWGLSTYDTAFRHTDRPCICCMLLPSRRGASRNSLCEGK